MADDYVKVANDAARARAAQQEQRDRADAARREQQDRIRRQVESSQRAERNR